MTVTTVISAAKAEAQADRNRGIPISRIIVARTVIVVVNDSGRRFIDHRRRRSCGRCSHGCGCTRRSWEQQVSHRVCLSVGIFVDDGDLRRRLLNPFDCNTLGSGDVGEFVDARQSHAVDDLIRRWRGRRCNRRRCRRGSGRLHGLGASAPGKETRGKKEDGDKFGFHDRNSVWCRCNRPREVPPLFPAPPPGLRNSTKKRGTKTAAGKCTLAKRESLLGVPKSASGRARRRPKQLPAPAEGAPAANWIVPSPHRRGR